jgi:putative ABC transport system permease protein
MVFLEASAKIHTQGGDSPRISVTGIDPLEQVALFSQRSPPSEKQGASASERDGGETVRAWIGSQFAFAKGSELCLHFGLKETCVKPEVISPEAEREASLGKSALVMDIHALQRAIGREGGVSGVIVKEPAGQSSEERRSFRRELEALVMEVTSGRLVLEGDEERQQRAEKLLGAFRMNVAVMVLMTLVVCAFTVFNSAQLSVRALLPELSTLRTLGLSRAWMVTAVILESALLGCVGAALGLTLGAPLSSVTAALFLSTAESLYRVPHVSETLSFFSYPELYGTSFFVGVLVSVLGAVLPALKVRKVVPGVGTRTVMQDPPPSMKGRLALALGLSLAGVLCVAVGFRLRSDLAAHGASFAIVGVVIALSAPLLLFSGAALKRFLLPVLRPRRALELLLGANGALGNIRASAVAVATTSSGLALLIGLGIMVESFRTTLGLWVEDSIAADFYLSRGADTPGQAGELSEDFIDDVIKVPGVAEVLRFSPREGTVCSAQGACLLLPLHAAEVRDQADRRRYRLIAGALDLEALNDGRAALVSESAAGRYGFKMGDALEIYFPGAAPFRVLVSGVYKDFTSERGNVLLSYQMLRARGFLSTAESAAVYLNSAASREGVREALETLGAKVQGLKLQDQSQLRGAVFEIFDRTFRITDVLKITVILVCALGFAVTLSQLAGERGREFRTVKTLGAPRSSLMLGVFIEGGILALPSMLLGMAGGILLSLLLVTVINPLSFGWTLGYVVSAETLALPVVAILAAYLLPLCWFVFQQAKLLARSDLSAE